MEIRFYLGVGALGIAHTTHVIFQLYQQALALHLRHYRFPGLEPVHSLELLRDVVVQGSVGLEYVHRFQAVPLAQLVVIGVVGRGDFHGAGTELGVNKLVSDDGHLPPHQWQNGLIPDQVVVASVRGIHRYGRVSQHGLRAGGGYSNKTSLVFSHRVVDIP